MARSQTGHNSGRRPATKLGFVVRGSPDYCCKGLCASQMACIMRFGGFGGSSG
ncbi:MAG: hypothetical protein WBO76_10980 [Saprospiraceae bacterium]